MIKPVIMLVSSPLQHLILH